jgi:hypothetical protein
MLKGDTRLPVADLVRSIVGQFLHEVSLEQLHWMMVENVGVNHCIVLPYGEPKDRFRRRTGRQK